MPEVTTTRAAAGVAASARLAGIPRLLNRTLMRCWSTGDVSKVQGPDEGGQRAYLPPAAEVEMSEMRHGQDAEAKGQVPLVINADFSLHRAATENRPHFRRPRSEGYR
jgi:hypothetical protein